MERRPLQLNWRTKGKPGGLSGIGVGGGGDGGGGWGEGGRNGASWEGGPGLCGRLAQLISLLGKAW